MDGKNGFFLAMARIHARQSFVSKVDQILVSFVRLVAYAWPKWRCQRLGGSQAEIFAGNFGDGVIADEFSMTRPLFSELCRSEKGRLFTLRVVTANDCSVDER